MAQLDELLVGLGFDYDPKEMTQFKKDIDGTVSILKSLTKAAVSSALAITGLTVASTIATDEQGKLAKEIGETVENIDAMQFALRRAGGTSDGMTSSLRQLAIRASEAARGMGSGVEAFGILGISSTDVNGNLKNTSDLMLEVSSRMQGLNNAQQIELADKLGIRDAVLLLQEGPEAIRELISEANALGVTTDEDAAIAEVFQDSLTDLWQISKQLARTLSRIVAPILKDIAGLISDWWIANRQMIEQNLPEWIDQATRALKLLTIAIGGLIAFRLASHLMTLITLMKGLTLSTLAFNIAALLIPIAIGAGITALLLLIEDAKVFFEGGESFIGDMIKKFPAWATEIEAVAFLFNGINIVVGAIYDGWKGIFDLFKTDIDFPEFLSNLPGFLGFLGNSTVQGASNLLPDLGSVSKSASTVVDKVEIFIQGGADTAENIGIAVRNAFQQTSEDLNSTVEQ